MTNGMVQRVVHFRQRGEQGPSGNQTETRYKSNNSGTTPPSFSETGGNTDWSTTPTAITTTNRYRWKIIRTRENDEASWGRWSASIDAYLSENANDYCIVLSTAWAKRDKNNNVTGALAGKAYKIDGSSQTPLSGATIKYGFTGQWSTQVTTSSDGSFANNSGDFDTAWTSGKCNRSYSIFASVMINNVAVCTEVVNIAFDGADGIGERGKPGRLYYYAGEYTSGTYDQYLMEETQAPFVKYGSDFWMLDFKGNEPSTLPAAATDNPSASSTCWTLMSSEQQYYIAKAFFGDYAQFGSAIISGDCMFSTNGRIGSTEYNNGATYLWNRPAYMWFVGNTEYFLADYSQQKGVSSGGAINVGQEILMKPQSIIQGTATLSRVQSEASTSDRVYLKLYDVTNGSYVNFVANGASVSEFRLTTTKQEVSLSYTNQLTSDKNVRWKIVNNYSSSRNLNIGFEVELANTFEPNWWVDLLTGRTYQTDAVVRGDVQAISVISSNDQMETVIEAGSVKVRSKTTQSYGIFRINSFGEVVLSMFDKDGNKVIDLGGTAETQINGEWVTWKLKYLSSSRPTSGDKSYYTASESDCSTYYQLQLGQVRNTNNALEYFLPPCDSETVGEQTTNQSVIGRDNNFFNSKASGANKTALENSITGLTKITNGYYIKPNNGRFDVEANQYGPTNYKVDLYHFNGGLLTEIITQRFSL